MARTPARNSRKQPAKHPAPKKRTAAPRKTKSRGPGQEERAATVDAPAAETPEPELIRPGVAPFARATAITNALTQATARSLDVEHTQRLVTSTLDKYDSRWARDPGRANGPYT